MVMIQLGECDQMRQDVGGHTESNRERVNDGSSGTGGAPFDRQKQKAPISGLYIVTRLIKQHGPMS